ncbi:MAG: Rap1a/Tai family immunity protein [Alphaproteobacteria bacterium]|nr:Rap1a/Tai family immunity protein [Alphaproteobacteria bacterium]
MNCRTGIFVALCLAACVALSGPTRAEFYDGNDLHLMCTSGGNVEDSGICSGYAAAILDAMAAHRERGLDFLGQKSCVPDGVKLEQAGERIVGYLERHPQWRHHPGAYLVALALSEAWPCPER